MSAREGADERKGGRTCLGYVFNFMLGMCREGCRKVIASKRGQTGRMEEREREREWQGRSYRDLVCGRVAC